jgi:hypothetical protein
MLEYFDKYAVADSETSLVLMGVKMLRCLRSVICGSPASFRTGNG